MATAPGKAKHKGTNSASVTFPATRRLLTLIIALILALPLSIATSLQAHADNTVANPAPAVSAADESGTLPVRIAVVLPLKSQLSEGRRSLEFYRGLLLAAEDKKAAGCNIQIAAFNEPHPDDEMTPMLESAAAKADVMVGFFYRNHVIAAGRYCEATGKIAAFPLSTFIPVDLKNNRACVFNATTIQQFTIRYAKITVGTLGKSNVIYAHSTTPANSAEVADYVAEMKRLGCKTKNLEAGFSITALEKQLSTKLPNIIITDTDNIEQLHSLFATIKSIKAVKPNYNITVVGSSPWMNLYSTPEIFTGVDTYIPVLENPNAQNAAATDLMARYATNFHTEASGNKPSDLIQGYDFGTMLIDGLSKYGTSFMLYPSATGHITHAYTFNNPDDGCWMNNNIRLLHFTPDGHQYLHEFMSK